MSTVVRITRCYGARLGAGIGEALQRPTSPVTARARVDSSWTWSNTVSGLPSASTVATSRATSAPSRPRDRTMQ